MSKKPITVERVERSFKRYRNFIYGWRAFQVAYFAFIVVVLAAGGPAYLAVYLILPPLWYALSYLWMGTAKSTRDLNLRTIATRDRLSRFGGTW